MTPTPPSACGRATDAPAEAQEAKDNLSRLKVAGEVLELAQLPPLAPSGGPTDPEEAVRQVDRARRGKAQGPLDDLLDDGKGLPPFERHLEEVRQELEALAAEPDEPAPAVPRVS
jgi:hypothetical protein